jgi:hypothetical protein
VGDLHLRRTAAREPQDPPESVRGMPVDQTERHTDRFALWRRQAIDSVKHGPAELLQSANGSSISDCTPTARATRQSRARSTRYSRSAVFPKPASPRSTRTPLRPVRTLSNTLSNGLTPCFDLARALADGPQTAHCRDGRKANRFRARIRFRPHQDATATEV